MKRPDQWPNVPFAAFVDTVGPAITEAFLNPLQQGFQDISGALYGVSATIISDEFNELSYAAGKVGQFDIVTSTNTTINSHLPFGLGQNGIWRISATATALMAWTALDAANWIEGFDFLFSGKVRIDARAELDVVAAPGFEIGLRDVVVPSLATFAAGSDSLNWFVYLDAVAYDTGIPVVNGRFYELQLARINGTAYAFIDGVLVVTAAYTTALQAVFRSMLIRSPGATIGNGFYVDYHRVWLQR